jgi:primosomal protein N' (replication factor Y)
MQNNHTITLFVDLILPVPIPQLFTYRVPIEMTEIIKIGMRVIVQFGKRKILTGVVAKIHQEPPKNYQAKYVLEILDDVPMVTPYQISLFQWMADYYMCYVGDVLQVALPSGLKISSLSKIQIRPECNILGLKLNEKEAKLIQTLQEKGELTYDEAAEILETENVYHIIQSLIVKEVVLIFEEVREKYTPKIVKRLKLSNEYITKTDLEKLTKKLEKQPKQLDIILAYLRQVPVLRDWTENEKGLEKEFFTKNEEFNKSSLQTLIKNQIFEEYEVVVSRFAEYLPKVSSKVLLSPSQKQASEQIMDCFTKQDVVLLNGITGSGKTEIYIDLVQKVLAGGSQVLFLLPEIALTTQMVARLQKIFGSQMGVYHSKFSDNERVEVWQGVVTGRFNFVVAVRSGIFLPFDNLGLIIVDEEHETSYKQHEPAPRYHARDMSLVIAKLQHCKVLLGSATPSLESFYQAKQGKYGLVMLKERFGTAQLPQIDLVDIKAERKNKLMKGSFTSVLLNAMKERLDKKEQIILFQNRRGYSPYMTCLECSYIPKCTNCDVTLTYHLGEHELKCHYCGHTQTPPKKCPACGSVRIQSVGVGTEKLEDEIKIHFPEAQVGRMDLDTTRTKNAYLQIIQAFENRQIDILVGTQMLSKGLDFDNVSLVGIFDADRMLNFPDFRSHERAYQLLTQVSGRAGRKEKKGLVLIQTQDTQQSLLHKVIRNDYEALYAMEIEDRAYFYYPPFTRLIRITTKHMDRNLSLETSQELADLLTKKLGKARILGPEAPIVGRIRNKYLFNILVKIERENVDLKAIKQFIMEQIEEIITTKKYKRVQVIVDVDPL